jgi:prepilin-type N-terminal cleavage/methylation domain-containing protein
VKKNSGFTLIEALVASAISLMAISMIYSIYLSGNDAWDARRYQAEIQAQGRLAMDMMVKELRETTRMSTQNPSPNLVIPSSPNNKQIDFYLPTYENITVNGTNTSVVHLDTDSAIEWDHGNKIQYQYVPGQKMLRRLEKGNFTTIALNVTDVQFIDQGIDPTLFNNELKILLSIARTTAKQRNITMNFTGMVRLRN